MISVDVKHHVYYFDCYRLKFQLSVISHFGEATRGWQRFAHKAWRAGLGGAVTTRTGNTFT